METQIDAKLSTSAIAILNKPLMQAGFIYRGFEVASLLAIEQSWPLEALRQLAEM